MKEGQLSALGDLAEAVRNGETVDLFDGDKLVAQVVPADVEKRQQEHVDQLVREGKMRRGTGKLPDDFFTRPRPDLGGSVLEQLLRDREDNW